MFQPLCASAADGAPPHQRIAQSHQTSPPRVASQEAQRWTAEGSLPEVVQARLLRKLPGHFVHSEARSDRDPEARAASGEGPRRRCLAHGGSCSCHNHQGSAHTRCYVIQAAFVVTSSQAYHRRLVLVSAPSRGNTKPRRPGAREGVAYLSDGRRTRIMKLHTPQSRTGELLYSRGAGQPVTARIRVATRVS